METAPKWKQNERPFLRLENTKNALFCPFLYFKVPKRTKIGNPHPSSSLILVPELVEGLPSSFSYVIRQNIGIFALVLELWKKYFI